MTNTNTKEFMQKVQNDLIIYFDERKDGLIAEVKNLLQNDKSLYNMPYKAGQRLVEGGCFDCYYSDVANTMADWFNCSVDEIWAYYKDDTQKLWASYIHIVAKNVACIYENKRCYLEEV